MMNKDLEEWTVTEVDDFLRSTGMMDLSHLSHQEKLQIIRVLKRDEKVLKTESTRVLKLKKEVQELKQKSALRPGDDADRICVRCRSELGLILNTGAECFKCHFMVCRNCRVVVTEDGLTWLCILCAKQAKLRTISGEWFYEKVSDRLKPQFESYVHGSNFVRDSLRQKKGGSPEKSAINSALRGARNRTSSASGITTREPSTASLTGGARENGTDSPDSAAITIQTKRVPSIIRGVSFDGYTNSGSNSIGVTNTPGVDCVTSSTNGQSNLNDQLTSSLADINSAFPNSYLAAKVRSGQIAACSSNAASTTSISNIPSSTGAASISSALQAKTNNNDTMLNYNSPLLSSPSRALQQQQQQLLQQSEQSLTSGNFLSPSRFHVNQQSTQMENNSYTLHHHYPNFPTVMDQQPTTPKSSLNSEGSQMNNNSYSNNKHLNSNLKRSQESLSSESSTATIGSGGARPKQTQRGGINSNTSVARKAANQTQHSPQITAAPFHHNEAPFTPSSTLPFSSTHVATVPSDKSETADTSSPEAAAFKTNSQTLPFPQSSRSDRGDGSPKTRSGVTDGGTDAAGKYATSPGKSSLHGGAANHKDPRCRTMQPMEYQDPQSMPYYAPVPHPGASFPGAHPGARPYFHQYYVDHCGPMPRPRRMGGMGIYHRQGSRYPPGFYPIDNTHQLILHKVEMLNKNTRRKFLMGSTPGAAAAGANVEDSQFGALPVQEFSPDNSEHAATLSSESERSHRSHHLDDDLDEGNRRRNSGHVHKQNSSDNYEHEQPQRRSSPHGDSTSGEGLGNSTSSNAGDGALQTAGSNSSLLQHDNLELGSRPSGYSCSVPATPEHKKNSAHGAWMQHPRMQFPPHMTSLHESYGLPHRRRGVPYPYPGGYRSLRPHHAGGPHASGPYRHPHPAQYRSLPPQSFGYFPPRFRGRPVPHGAGGGFPSSRYSSQEDFRGSSKSLAIYPSDLHSSTLDMHERSSPHQPHPRFAPRSRMGGSRESLDVQMQNRESRSLSRSFPAGAPGVQGGGAGVRQQRASSLPPPEDHLGEDEQVLSLVQPLSSSIVPSLVNTLTSSRHSHDGREQPEPITPDSNPVVRKKDTNRRRVNSVNIITPENNNNNNGNNGNLTTSKQKTANTTPPSKMHHLKKIVSKRMSVKDHERSFKGKDNPNDNLFLSQTQSEQDVSVIGTVAISREASSSYQTMNPSKTASAMSLAGTSATSNHSSAQSSQASLTPTNNIKKRSSSQSSLTSLGSAKEKLRNSGKKLSASIQKLTTHKKASVSIRDPKDFEFCEVMSGENNSGGSNKSVFGTVEYSLIFDASSKTLKMENLTFCGPQEIADGHEKTKLKQQSSIYLKVTCTSSNQTLKQKTEKLQLAVGKITFPDKLKFQLAKPRLANISLRIMVMSKSQIGKDSLIGEVHELLNERTEYNRPAIKCPLTLYANNEDKDIGTVKLSVRFNPTESVNLRISAQGLPKRGSSEPSTYCKLHLLPLPTKFKSKAVVKHSADPVYLETIAVPFRGASLSDFCLELCIVLSGSNLKSVLGGVRLSNGTATYQGAVVEWMQSTLEEINFWQRVQANTGEWVQGHLRLRSNFNPLK